MELWALKEPSGSIWYFSKIFKVFYTNHIQNSLKLIVCRANNTTIYLLIYPSCHHHSLYTGYVVHRVCFHQFFILLPVTSQPSRSRRQSLPRPQRLIFQNFLLKCWKILLLLEILFHIWQFNITKNFQLFTKSFQFQIVKFRC